MTRDLGDLIRTTGDDAAQSTARAFTPDAAASLFRATRRRHLTHRAGAGAATACVAAVIGIAALHPWGTTTPATTPSPTATSAPTATTPTTTGPSTTPTTSPTAAASTKPVIIGTVTKNPLLPDAKPLEAGLLENAGPGWALVEYVTGDHGGSQTGAVQADDVVYLIDPSGVHYEVRNLGPNWGGRILDWQPGSDRVLVAPAPGSSGVAAGTVQILDLETGQVVNTFAVADAPINTASFTRPTGQNVVVETVTADRLLVRRFSPTGQLLSTLADLRRPSADSLDARWVYSEDGTYAVVGVWFWDLDFGLRRVAYDGLTTTTLPAPTSTDGCVPLRWWDAGRVLASCWQDYGPAPDDASTRLEATNLWAVPVDGSDPEQLTHYIPTWMFDHGLQNVWDFDGTRFELTGGHDCSDANLLRVDATGTSQTAYPNILDATRAGDRILVTVGCGNSALYSFDPATGDATPYFVPTSENAWLGQVLAR